MAFHSSLDKAHIEWQQRVKEGGADCRELLTTRAIGRELPLVKALDNQEFESGSLQLAQRSCAFLLSRFLDLGVIDSYTSSGGSASQGDFYITRPGGMLVLRVHSFRYDSTIKINADITPLQYVTLVSLRRNAHLNRVKHQVTVVYFMQFSTALSNHSFVYCRCAQSVKPSIGTFSAFPNP